MAEQEARERAARAGEARTEAEQLRAKAEKLAPDVVADGRGRQGTDQSAHRDQTPRPDQPGGGGATRR